MRARHLHLGIRDDVEGRASTGNCLHVLEQSLWCKVCTDESLLQWAFVTRPQMNKLKVDTKFDMPPAHQLLGNQDEQVRARTTGRHRQATTEGLVHPEQASAELAHLGRGIRGVLLLNDGLQDILNHTTGSKLKISHTNTQMWPTKTRNTRPAILLKFLLFAIICICCNCLYLLFLCFVL